jgi:hypothetical protein
MDKGHTGRSSALGWRLRCGDRVVAVVRLGLLSTSAVTCTGEGTCAVPVAILKRPSARAKSRTASACHLPRPTTCPEPSTLRPAGCITRTSKSAVGVVHASAESSVGGSSAQSLPSQARRGKNDPRRTERPPPLILRPVSRGRTRCQFIETTTRRPPVTGRAMTSVVGFGDETGTMRPPSRTRETDKCALALA